MIGYIYSLGEPGTGEVRYVGQTCDVRQRFYAHLSHISNSAISRWVQSLCATDRKPVLCVLETVDFDDLPKLLEREEHWIAHFISQGFPLLNTLIEGIGHRHSSETRQRMSLSHLGLRANFHIKHKQSRNNSHRKLTEADIAYIRSKCPFAGAYSYTLLAQELGVNRTTVARIVQNKTFKDYRVSLEGHVDEKVNHENNQNTNERKV